MDSFVPPLLRDETVYSWIARWGILSGYPSHRSAVRVLLDSDSKQLASSFPSFLPKTHHYSRCTLGDLVEKHTVLPFFKPFITDDNYRMAKFALLSGKTEFLHSRLSLVANRVSMSEPLRYCPVCTQYDYESLGYTFWRINHQLPGISVCLLHQKRLQRVQVARRELVLPPVDRNASKSTIEISKSEYRLCQLITESFKYNGSSIENCRLRDCYISLLRNRSLATDNNSLKMHKFRQELNEHWRDLSDELALQVLTSSSSRNSDSTYPANIFYQQNCQHHPLKHLLIIGFLFENWDVFIRAYNQDSKSFNVYSSKKVSVSLVDDNEIEIITHLKNGESMRNVAKRVNRSIGYVKKLAFLNDVETESRAQKLFSSERKTVIELANQGRSSSAIANEINCCVGAVEQILSQTSGLIEDRKRIRFINNRDKHRAIILKLVKTHSRRTDIQKTARSSYTFLFKHDKEWLNEFLPSPIARIDRYKG
jgi:hypothetical protein